MTHMVIALKNGCLIMRDDNVGEWAEASGLLFSKKVNNVDYYDIYNAGIIPLYNPVTSIQILF